MNVTSISDKSSCNFLGPKKKKENQLFSLFLLAKCNKYLSCHQTLESFLSTPFYTPECFHFNSYCQRLADMVTTKKNWTWLFLCLVGLAWCLRWGIRKNWAHDAPGLGVRAQESSKTGFLLWALSAVPAYRFFSKLIIQSCLTYILCQ